MGGGGISLNSPSENSLEKDLRKNTYIAIATAPLLTLGDIALGALEKNNRKDTFVKTAKACAKDFSKDRKNVVAGFCKYVLRNEKLAKKVFDIKNSNKKMFAAFLAAETLGCFILTKLCSDWGTKRKHKKNIV